MADTKNILAVDLEMLRRTFEDRGIVRLENLLPAAKVLSARKTLRKQMQNAGIWQSGAWKVDHLRDAPINEGAKFARCLKGCPEFDALVDDEIPHLVNRLLQGQETFTGMDSPQPLFTLPNSDSWNVPYMHWHLDAPRLPNRGIPGVQVFTFLETVTPTGGGTVAVAGSHRLLNGGERISSREIKRRLKQEPYFRDLMSKSYADRQRFVLEVERCGDVELQVVAMHGEPGDVYFADLRLLHSAAPNATSTPRVMLTRRYYLESVRNLIFR